MMHEFQVHVSSWADDSLYDCFDSLEEARELAKRLQSEGRDDVYIREATVIRLDSGIGGTVTTTIPRTIEPQILAVVDGGFVWFQFEGFEPWYCVPSFNDRDVLSSPFPDVEYSSTMPEGDGQTEFWFNRIYQLFHIVP